jgi:hypothetical protein
VTLPLGTSILPSTADGLQSCDDAQITIGSNAEPTCPDAPKVGRLR